MRKYGRFLRLVAASTLSQWGVAVRTEDLEDLVQEAWTRLVDRWGPGLAFDGCEAELRAYLWRTTRNVTVDAVRARRTEKRGKGWRRCPAEGRDDHLDRIADHRRDPEERVLCREQRARFRRRFAPFTSPSRRRRDLAVLEMAVVDGMTSRQVAHLLGGGLTASVVDSLVHRLRKGLAREGVALPRRT